MALTDIGKAFVMRNDMRVASVWIALSSDGSAEQSGSSYARRALPPTGADAANGRVVSETDGTLSILGSSLPFTIYTPSDASAPDSTHCALYDASTGGNILTDWQMLAVDVAAPVMGQAYRLSIFSLAP